MSEQPAILTRYRTKVHAKNRNSDYGIPVDVFASTMHEAINRAVDVGWRGHRDDAMVTVFNVEQVIAYPATERTEP